jgi:L-alanine-DL-glutamate epimerase-like enolase superfamily enzyme
MKLKSCTPYVVDNPSCIGGRVLTFIKLETDEGIIGWGETSSNFMFYDICKAYPKMVSEIFDSFLKGEDALARSKNCKKIYEVVCSHHSDLLVACIISAFDIAMWDIAGKACGKPIYELLGGKFRDRLRSYTYIYPVEYGAKEAKKDSSGIAALHGSWKNPLEIVQNAKHYANMGYSALKFDPIKELNRNGYPPSPWEISLEELYISEKTISSIRDALPYVDILIGTHGQLTTSSAIRLGKIMEKYNVAWFEEPIPPENTKEMAKVARAVNIPIATGERLSFASDFQRLFEDDACSIAQADVGTAGGITELVKISAMAEQKYIQMAPHVWGGPIIWAASIQFDLACPNFLIQETINEGQGFFRRLIDEPIEWKEGYIYPNNRPGLGINLVETELIKHAAI